MLIRTALALFISLPATAQQQQEVKPVLSDAYKKLIQKKPNAGNPTIDSSISSLRFSKLTMGDNRYFYYYTQSGLLQNITIEDNKIKMTPYVAKQLTISGSYTATVSSVSANRQPLLQHEYAQGRSVNGELVWHGAETNELFSYGPGLSQLEYDGSTYSYDTNGKLVPKGTGKQIPANVYDNSILHQAIEWKQRLTAIAEYKINGVQKYYTKLSAAQSREQLVIKDNKNTGYTFSFTAGATLFNNIKLTAGIETQEQNFTNGNRNGFLNRVYQQSLLTPVSFSNSQGYILNNGQRRFSNTNDNPFFLLNKTNPYEYKNRQLKFSAEYKLNRFTFKSIYAPSQTDQFHMEGYQPGTTFFPAGINNSRQQKNNIKTLTNSFSYLSKWSDNWQHSINASFINGWYNVAVAYPTLSAYYNWKRNTTDAAFLYNGAWRGDGPFETGFSLGNNFYASSTATKNYSWLPTAGVYVRWNRIFDRGYLRLFANTKKTVYEPSITQSFAGITSVKLNTAEAMKYYPLKEVNGFTGLNAEQHTQYNAGLDFTYSYWLSFNANVYVTYVKDAIFPTLLPGSIALKNMANYRSSGIELQLNNRVRLNYNYNKTIGNSLSFFLNRNTITGIDSRFENTPVAGFSNVYKALVKGYAAASIMGSDYVYDDKGRKVIGTDGFPLVSNQQKIIGNPIPDFTIKLNQSLTLKRLSFILDWEWRKCGDVWNGTRAVLDYYGRSAGSAEHRNIKQYVFDGVTQSGTVNNTAVDFYNPALPVEQNRWVRYGYSGVAKDYIEKGSFVKLNNIAVTYTIPVKWLRNLELTAAANNIFIWSAYKGVDPAQLFADQAAAEGLDFFNLPSLKRYSFTLSVQF